MADELDVAFKPDAVLAQAFQDLTVNKTITQAQYQKILSQQTSKIMQENNLRAVGIGGQGSFSPNLNAYSPGDELNASHYQRQEELKKLQKNGTPEDEVKSAETLVQTITDGYVIKCDKHLEVKEKEIMTV